MDVKVEDLKVLFSEEQIQKRIKELADEMNACLLYTSPSPRD